MSGAVRGDFGHSTRFNAPVADVLWPRLWLTAKLMFWVMVVMIPGALLLGVLAGMREGSTQDRVLSTVAIATTSTPEYVSVLPVHMIFLIRVIRARAASARQRAVDLETFRAVKSGQDHART